MSELIELTDFEARYPSVNDPEIQTKIAAKWEFARLASNPRDFHINPSGLYNHQELTRRLLNNYSRMVLMYKTGTGKSHFIGGLGEAVKDARAEGRGIKGVIIVVKGKTQVYDMKRTLVCKSTHGRYLVDVAPGSSERGLKNTISRALGEWYDIRTYGAFAKEIAKLETREAISERFSDYVIVFDEFHNIRLLNERLNLLSQNRNRPLKPSEDITLQMWKLSHYSQRSIVLGLSASIVINNVQEAVSTLNIILPENRQIPRETRMSTISVEELETYVRGHISYVRDPDTQVYRMNIGTRDNYVQESNGVQYPSNLVFEFLPMSKKHTRSYRIAYLMERNAMDEDNQDNFRISARQASRAIYPDGSWGNDGFNRYILPNKGWYKPQKDLLSYIKDGTMGNLSPSIAKLIEICRRAKGLVVVFDELVDGSGLNYNAVVMDATGLFEKFDGSSSMFISSGRSGAAPYCGGNKRDRKVRPEIKSISATGKIRYTMINKDTPNSHLPNILEAISSPENKNSDYIRVVMISGRGKEGINFDNMLYYVQYAGVWTPTTEEQASSRGFRSTSHTYLLGKVIERVAREGMSEIELRIAAEKGADENTLKALSQPMDQELASKWSNVIVEMYRFTTLPDSETGNIIVDITEEDINRLTKFGLSKARPEYLYLKDTGISDEFLVSLAGGMDRKTAISLLNYINNPKIASSGQEDIPANFKGYNYTEEDIVRFTKGQYNPMEIAYIENYASLDVAIPNSMNRSQAIETLNFIYKANTNRRLPSIDVTMYRYTENKDIEFSVFRNKLQRCAIDCLIQRNRNIRPEDKDFSKASDYGPANWKCFSPPPSELDYSTSDAFYMNESIDLIKPYLLEYFKINGSGTIEEILDSLNLPPELERYNRVKYVEIALARMIIDKEMVDERFGFAVYIQENMGKYITVKEFPTEVLTGLDHTTSYYGSTFMVHNKRQIDKFVTEKELGTVDDKLKSIASIPMSMDNYNTVLKKTIISMHVETQVSILESAIVKLVSGRSDQLNNAILHSFRFVYFNLPEPLRLIQMVTNTGKSRGRKPKALKELEDSILLGEPNAERVYIHNLYSHSQGHVKYNHVNSIKSISGKTRIYKPSEGKWRDTAEYESKVYKMYMEAVIKRRIDEFNERFPVAYKVDIGDDIFRIMDVLNDKQKTKVIVEQEQGGRGRGRGRGRPPKSATEDGGKRDKNRGIDCTSITIPRLTVMAYNLGIPSPDIGVDIEEQSKDDALMMKYNLNDAELKVWKQTPSIARPERSKYLEMYDMLYYAEQWRKGSMCKLLNEFFESKEMVLYLR